MQEHVYPSVTHAELLIRLLGIVTEDESKVRILIYLVKRFMMD